MSTQTFLEQFESHYRWDSIPAKRYFRSAKNINRGMKESHRLALTLGGVIDRALDDIEGLQSSDYETYQVFEKDDLVFKLIDLENIKTSRVGHVPRRGIMSPAYIRLFATSKNVAPRYYYWLFFAAYLNNIFNGLGGGVRQNLTPTDLLEFPIPAPPLETQKAIADFLDNETARIDKLVQKKKEALSIIEARHQNYVDSRMEKFSVRRIKTVADSQLSNVDKHIYADEFPVNVVHYTDVYYNDTITENTSLPNGSVSALEKKKFTLKGGEVLITKDSETPDDIGVPVYIDSVNENTVCGYHIAIIRPRKALNGRFLFWALRTNKVKDYFFLNAQGVTRYGLSIGKIGDCPIPYADDLGEQKEIAKDFFVRDSKKNMLIIKIHESIKRLTEYRAALITAAVTGQMEV